MFYTYLLKSLKDESFYCGITRDLEQRLHFHNNGGLTTTAQKRPWDLVYFKRHSSYNEARKHEKWLKKKNTEYKEKLAQLAPPMTGGVK